MPRRLALASLCAATLLIAGCSGQTGGGAGGDGGDGKTLTIYSGRSETLVQPIIEKLQEETGLKVEVRYGGSSELAAQLLEEGEATEADLFFSQDAGALGALAKADRLTPLDSAVTQPVMDGFVDKDGRWVATSARARVLVYNPEKVPEVENMTGIDDILDREYRGQIGYAPTNASFHSFVTALRVIRGEDEAKNWLTEFKDLEPRAYDKNGAILNGVDSGEIEIGLINHYYWYEKVAEVGEDNVPSRIRFLDSDDPGALMNVAGVGVIMGSDDAEGAVKAVEYLLSDDAQTYFAEQTFEYPVVESVPAAEGLPPLKASSIDLNELDSLDKSLAMLNEVGLS